MSPDPLIAVEGNWMNYNRYLYCLGNPVKFADPTGTQVNNYFFTLIKELLECAKSRLKLSVLLSYISYF
ncbi:MAG: hypothetical protein KBT22_11130 [Bacteroidales bacterium]|nr:hypothetical protein [Candidatus Scybalocola fimicaballi]